MDVDEYKNMRVPTSAWERAKEAKRDGETWGDYLLRCADTEPTVTVELDDEQEQAVREIVRDELEQQEQQD